MLKASLFAGGCQHRVNDAGSCRSAELWATVMLSMMGPCCRDGPGRGGLGSLTSRTHRALLSLHAGQNPQNEELHPASAVASPGMQFCNCSPGGAGGGGVEVSRTGGRAAGVRVGGE